MSGPFRPPREPTAADIARLQRLLAGSAAAGIQKGVVVPRLNQPYATGTTLPLLGQLAIAGHGQGGLVLPRIDLTQAPIKYFWAFLGLEDYLAPWTVAQVGVYNNDFWNNLLIRQYPKDILIAELACLNSLMRKPSLYQQTQAAFSALLPDDMRARFDNTMAQTDTERVFLARQPILLAMRAVLLSTGPVAQNLPISSGMVAIMLAHGFATQLGHLQESGPDLWPTVNGAVAMEVIQNLLFNQREDIYPRLDRYGRLWDDYGIRLVRTNLRMSPGALLEEAVGVSREELFAVAFSLLARNLNWQPGQGFVWDPFGGIGMDRGTFQKALEVFSTDEATLSSELAAAPMNWAMLPFERHPVLRLRSGVIVLDEGYLLDRVTGGLYWLVFDHENARSKTDGDVWSQAYAEMIEALAEDSLRTMAPRVVGGGTTFYTEDEMKTAYGKGVRRSDAAIDSAPTFAVFEVQKGQVSLDTRQEGRLDRFIADTKRMVLDKAEQLNGTGLAILKDEQALTGYPPSRGRRIQPVAVQGLTYPVNPITDEYIDIKLKERGLLQDSRFLPLCIIDLGELEMLEGLVHSRGISVAEVLAAWKGSPGRRFSLGNYLQETYSDGGVFQYRPPRMAQTFDDFVEAITRVLKPDSGTVQPVAEQEPAST